MGNMSNPTINRWGLNLFWYRFWYNDKNTSLTIHQDKLINDLLLIYVHYGLLHFKNIFTNKYWYVNFQINSKLIQNNYNLKYFKLMEYKNKINNERRISKIRKKTKNLYFSKLWILKYQNWLIINFYCFQPLLNKNSKKELYKKDINLYLKSNNTSNVISRYKLIYLYILNKQLSKKTYYTF